MTHTATETVHVPVTATVDNGIGESTVVDIGTVPDWSLPLTKEWKQTYRQVALDIAAASIPLPSRGVRVTFTPHLEQI